MEIPLSLGTKEVTARRLPAYSRFQGGYCNKLGRILKVVGRLLEFRQMVTRSPLRVAAILLGFIRSRMVFGKNKAALAARVCLPDLSVFPIVVMKSR